MSSVCFFFIEEILNIMSHVFLALESYGVFLLDIIN